MHININNAYFCNLFLFKNISREKHEITKSEINDSYISNPSFSESLNEE